MVATTNTSGNKMSVNNADAITLATQINAEHEACERLREAITDLAACRLVDLSACADGVTVTLVKEGR